MPKVPRLTTGTVGDARAKPVFIFGLLRLAVIPSNASDSDPVDDQHPPYNTMLDVGGTVTAISAIFPPETGPKGAKTRKGAKGAQSPKARKRRK